MAVRNFYGLKRPRAIAAEEEEEQQTSATIRGDAVTTSDRHPPYQSGPLASGMTIASKHVKRSLLEPESVYKEFPRQKMVLDFALNCYQSVGIFAYESEEFGRDGQRRYIATTYYEFGKRYLTVDGKRIPGNCYEVIPEGVACHLYFDIEFKREVNPTVDPILILEIFIKYVYYQLYVMYHVTCDRSNILDLDSTTPQKFSRHLIFHMPSAVFRNNILAGQFVRSICDQLRKFEHLVEGGMEVEEAYKRVYSSLKGSNTGSSCPSGKELLQLFVKNEKGGKVLICDEAVYTRNRNFRLYRSSKLGKSTKLQVAKESKFRSSYSEGASSRRRWSKHFNTLMDSLVCNVSFHTTEHMRILPSSSGIETKPSQTLDGTSQSLPPAEIGTISLNLTAVAEAESATGFNHSPFPSVDLFITSQLTKGGVQGSVRRWTYFPKGKLVQYDIQHNRWCENIGRAHKSNNIMIIADLKRGTYYQKCHDPDCRRINFRSNEIPIPLVCNPVLQQLEEEKRQTEEARLYVGDVSLEDILNQGFEQTELQEEASQDSSVLSSEEVKIYSGDLESGRQFKETSLIRNCQSMKNNSSPEDLDTILKEALEDYEARLSLTGLMSSQ